MSEKNRHLSFLFALLMLVSLLPGEALAEETEAAELPVLALTAETAVEEGLVFVPAEENEAEENEIGGPEAEGAVIELPAEAGTDPLLDGGPVTGTVCSGRVTWTVTEDGTLTISGKGAVDEGWGWKDYPVWQVYRERVTAIVVEEGITALGDYAFTGLHSATSVKLPNSLRSIGASAFESCWSLESLTLPEGLGSIGEGAFNLCQSLASVTIGAGLTAIPAYTFSDCSELLQVTIPASVTAIEKNAFAGCPLSSVRYGGTRAQWDAVKIAEGNGALLAAYGGGVSGTLSTGLTWRLDSDGRLTISGSGAMPDFDYENPKPWDCAGITAVVAEEGVTGIGSDAFYKAVSLESVLLPASLKSIGEDAFRECTALKEISIPDNVTSIGGTAFLNCVALTAVTLPATLAEVGYDAFYRCDAIRKVTFAGTREQWDSFDLPFSMKLAWLGELTGECGEGMTWKLDSDRVLTVAGSGVVEQSDWDYASSFAEKVVLSPGVTGVGDWAFSYFSAMRQIELPESVKTIGVGAFTNCPALESIEIPSGVTVLPAGYYDSQMFNGCVSLRSVSLPTGLKELGSDTFRGCTSLSEIRYGGTREQWEAVDSGSGNEIVPLLAFGSVSGSAGDDAVWTLTKDGVLTVSGTGDTDFGISRYGKDAWLPAQIPVRVVVESGITSIGDAMCRGLTNLKEVVIADTVKSIGAEAFMGCESLESIEIPASVEIIDGYCDTRSAYGCQGAFANCTALSEVTFGANSRLRTIGACAFDGCVCLTGIDLPGGLAEIGERAFAESSLQSVTIPDDVDAIGKNAFNGTKLNRIELPGTVGTIGAGAFAYTTGRGLSVRWPAGGQILDDEVFSGSRLTAIELPEGIEDYYYECFRNCSELEQIELPESSKNIGQRAFAGSGLRRIYIPAGLEHVYPEAFDGCGQLMDVYYGGTEAQWQALAIDDNNEALRNAEIHFGAEGLPKEAGTTLPDAAAFLEGPRPDAYSAAQILRQFVGLA